MRLIPLTRLGLRLVIVKRLQASLAKSVCRSFTSATQATMLSRCGLRRQLSQNLVSCSLLDVEADKIHVHVDDMERMKLKDELVEVARVPYSDWRVLELELAWSVRQAAMLIVARMANGNKLTTLASGDPYASK